MNKAVRFTLITVTIDLIIAALILIIITAGYGNPFRDFIGIISDFALNFTVGIAFLAFASYYIGNKMHKLICERKWNSILVGVCGLILILIFGILGGSTVGFIEFGVLDSNDTISEMIFDYYYKPLVLILAYGGIPTIITGGILGVFIARITCYNNVYKT